MSGEENPFQVSPSSYGDRSGRDLDPVIAQVTPRTIELLNQTRPWVRLIGILLWIGVVLMVLAVLGLTVTGLSGGGPQLLILAAAYGLVAILYAVIASKLMRYGRQIELLSQTEAVYELESALDAQRSFWKLIGIITLVALIGYLVAMVAMVVGMIGIAGSSGRA